MNLEVIETRRPHCFELIEARLDRHRDFPSIWQPRRHGTKLFQRDEAGRFRMEDEPEIIGSAAVGKLRVDQRGQPADFESDSVNHRSVWARAALTTGAFSRAPRLTRRGSASAPRNRRACRPA